MLSYGRLVARAVLGGLSQTDGRDYSLISASYGFGKDFRKGILKKGMCYGDDACFIARHRTADVLGELCGISYTLEGGLTPTVRSGDLQLASPRTCADPRDENIAAPTPSETRAIAPLPCAQFTSCD